MNALTNIQIGTWHENDDVRSVLAEMVDSPPAWVRNPLDHPFDGSPRWMYDRADERVQKLFWFASGWFAATGRFDLTVDEVIGNAIAKRREETAKQGRVAYWLDQGLCLGEARLRADDDLPSNELEAR